MTKKDFLDKWFSKQLLSNEFINELDELLLDYHAEKQELIQYRGIPETLARRDKSFDGWKPTKHLRWHSKILQQKWVNDKGQIIWQNVIET